MQTHIKVVGWLYILSGVFWAATALFIFVLLIGIGAITGDETAFGILALVGVVTAAFLIFVGAPGIIAGIGLINFKPWARIMGLVLAVLNLPAFPIGTAVGIYTLYALLDDDASRLFASSAAQITAGNVM